MSEFLPGTAELRHLQDTQVRCPTTDWTRIAAWRNVVENLTLIGLTRAPQRRRVVCSRVTLEITIHSTLPAFGVANRARSSVDFKLVFELQVVWPSVLTVAKFELWFLSSSEASRRAQRLSWTLIAMASLLQPVCTFDYRVIDGLLSYDPASYR